MSLSRCRFFRLKNVVNSGFWSVGRIWASLRKDDQVILMVVSQRVESNVVVNDMSVGCAFQMFSEISVKQIG